MPKELHEIKKFLAGTVTTPTETDIPDEAASFSLNIDPVSEDGVLTGIPDDFILQSDATFSASTVDDQAFDADKMAMVNNDGKRDVVAYEAGADKIWNIVDFQGTSTGYIKVATISATDSDPDTFVDSGSGFLTAGFIDEGQQIHVSGFADDENNGTFLVSGVTSNTITLDSSHELVAVAASLDITISAFVIDKGVKTNSTGTCTMQVNNKEVHIGMGKGVDDRPLWCGHISHEQFGTGQVGLQLENAELASPTTFPSMHKVLKADDGMIYAIEYGGKYLWKFEDSTKTVKEKSKSIFTSSTALASAESGFLWGFDAGVGQWGTIYKMSTATLEIVQTNQIDADPAEPTEYELQDMVATDGKLWLAYAHKTHTLSNVNFEHEKILWNIDKPVDSGNVTLEDVTPHPEPTGDWNQNTNSETFWGDACHTYVNTDGWASSTNNGDAWIRSVKFRPYRNCLIAVRDASDEVAWFTQIRKQSDGGTPYCVYFTNYNPNNPYQYYHHGFPVGTVNNMCVYVIKESYDRAGSGDVASHNVQNLVVMDLRGMINYGCIGSTVLDDGALSPPPYGPIYISCFDPANTDRVALMRVSSYYHTHGAISEHAQYTRTQYFNGINPWDSMGTNHTHQLEFDSAYTAHDEGDFDAPIITMTPGDVRLQIFSSLSIGKWGTALKAFINPVTFDLMSNIDLNFMDHTANSDWKADVSYFWKCSFLYDGYQEGPLSDSFQTAAQPGGDVTTDQWIRIRLYNPESLSKRISHIQLYRAENNTSNGEIENKGFYRLLGSFPLDTTFIPQSSDNWGEFRQKEFIDIWSKTRSSYEALNGISEVLDNFQINYALSAQLNNQHFVANCYHYELEDTDLIMFKSKPYNFDQFDWSSDLLRLPTKPTALASFNGRIYAFDENNTYRIEPNSFYIEDTFEGVGCIGPEAVAVTEYGMCFADYNNIYLHDGNNPKPIGEPILRGDTYAWQGRDKTWPSKIMFDGSRNSFVIIFRYGADYIAWVYNLSRGRWDLWETFGSTEPLGILTGKNGEMFISDGTNLKHYLGGDGKRAWDWTSKKFTMNSDTQIKKFRKFRTTGTPTGTLGTEVYVKVDGANVNEIGGDKSEFTVDVPNGKHVQWFFTDQTDNVDSIGTIFRRRPVK